MSDPAGVGDDAMERAVRALRHRDHTVASLDAVLARAGVAEGERERAIEQVRALGYVDDSRFAFRRAESLAERGAGDLKIERDLERHGVSSELVAAALSSLDPEQARVQRIVARREATPATARLLLSRGFSADVVEAVVADSDTWRIG